MPLDPECNSEASVAKHVSGYRCIAVTIESCLRCFYVQPRNKKIRIKIGTGMPKSQSKMYPVAPACSIFRAKGIISPPSRHESHQAMDVRVLIYSAVIGVAPDETLEVGARVQTRPISVRP